MEYVLSCMFLLYNMKVKKDITNFMSINLTVYMEKHQFLEKYKLPKLLRKRKKIWIFLNLFLNLN